MCGSLQNLESPVLHRLTRNRVHRHIVIIVIWTLVECADSMLDGSFKSVLGIRIYPQGSSRLDGNFKAVLGWKAVLGHRT